MLDVGVDTAAVAAAVGFLAAYVMAALVDRQMESAFSGFWYPKQKQLRNGLKQARQLARTPPRETVELRAVRSA